MRELRRRWPMVGRDGARARIRDVLTAGDVGVLVLRGPSGVGKTRLMEESLDGPHVRIAAAGRTTGIPLEPLADLFSRAEGHAVADPGGDTATMISRARRGLAALAGQRAVPVLAVDDLPWLDPLSVTVLGALVSDGSARVVATARSEEPLPDVVLTWWRSGRAVQLDVAPLPVAEVGDLLEEVLGAPVAPAAVAALHGASTGLPLHLRELAAGAVEAGELVETAGVWRLVDEGSPELSVTPALRELLLARIDRRPPTERTFLERLAACSALRLSEIPGEAATVVELATVLEEVGLVEIVDAADPDPVVRLAHPQVATLLRERLPQLRSRTLLLEQVTQVEGRSSGERDALRVAEWRLAATGTADPDTLVRGARLALGALDRAAAERLALAATRSVDADDGVGPAAWLLLARARWENGRPEDARVTLDEAVARGVVAPDAPDAAVLRCAATVDDPRRSAEALAALHDLADHVRTGHRPDLAATVAELLLELDRVGDALALVEELLEPAAAAVALGSVSDAVGVLVADPSIVAARVYAEAARATDARRHAREAVARARAHADVARAGLLAEALGAQCRVLVNDLGPLEAIDVGREALTHAVTARGASVTADIEYDLSLAYGLLSQPRISERWCRDIISSASVRRHPRHLDRGLGVTAFNAVGMGDHERMAWAFAELDELAVPAEEAPWATRADALRRAFVHGDRRGARELLSGLARLDEERGADLWAANDWFEILTTYGSPDTDEADLGRLRAIAERCDSRYVDLLCAHATAATTHDLDGLVAVLDRWSEHSCWWNARRAVVRAVATARTRGDAGRAAALERRFQTIARRSPEVVVPPLDASTVVPLTRREREVAELAAGGATSSEIATQLVLSVRTVDNHLGNAYHKLGVTRRRELADALRS